VRARGRLFRKYVVIILVLVSGALLTSGAVEIYFSYQENKAALVAVQREKAIGAASKIEAFITEIEHQVGWTTQPQLVAPGAALDQRRFDFLRLLRQVPAITEVSYLDPEGKEQLRVSRLAMDVVGSQKDESGDPKFREARAGHTYYGPVYFRKESEPYMSIAMAGSGSRSAGPSGAPAGSGAGVTVVDVNLKFIWDVVSQIRVGKAGRAYAVDGRGNLLAHPDISLVLQKTAFADLPQVRAALAGPPRPGEGHEDLAIARDFRNHRVLTTYATIPSLRWSVFVEQPLEEAFEPLRASIQRTALLLLLGVVLSFLASLVLARRMVRPIAALQAGAAAFGAGDLGERIDVRTGDELEALADQFNRMAVQLKESYEGLERKVEERTRELSEALEQQTATSEILRVINAAQLDLQPVFDAIAASAVRLCDGLMGGVFLVEDQQVRLAAHHNFPREAMEGIFPAPLDSDLITARAIVARHVVHTPDALAESDYRHKAVAERVGYRGMLSVPMLRDGAPIGAITVARTQPGAFTDTQIALLQTFADQAVIAIENVRLFTELQRRNAEITEALEQQTATSEILRVISRSQTETRPVFEAIVQSAVKLCDGFFCVAYRLEGELVHVVAHNNFTPAMQAALQRVFPARIDADIVAAQSIREARTIHIDDVLAAGAPAMSREIGAAVASRTLLTVPMLRDGVAIGAIGVGRTERRPFSAKQVALLQIFADQAVIAIENVRLFTELQERTSQLQVASRHKDEFLANMSHELRTPLNAVIGFSEVLLERMFGDINEKQEEYLTDILSSGRHLLSLINDILDLSKIEAGRMELDVTEFDLPMAIDNALTLVRERAARRGLTLSEDVDEHLGPFRGDQRKIKQILLNLLSNAVKFTPEGGRVGVRAILKGDAVEISVADTGVGIAPEDQEAVFEEFRQVGTDVAKKHEGTGLGLALTRRFVELHGGSIWVESAVGAGSTFTFALPMRH
jgi:signal transduction histidine kinase